MLAIKQQGDAVATLNHNGSDWSLQYLPTARRELLPNLPIPADGKPYTFKTPPNFLMNLLPEGPRLEALIGKGTSVKNLTPQHYMALFSRALDLENIGDIQVTYLGADEELPVVHKPAGTNIFDGTTIKELGTVPRYDFLRSRIETRFFAAGLGGNKPKLFYNAPEGNYIIKEYDMPYVAQSEVNSLRAFASTGGKATICESFGQLLVSRRFDVGENDSRHSVCHAADLEPGVDKRTGSCERVLKNIGQYAGPDAAKAVFKQMIFCYVLGDTDLHKGNIALIRKSGTTDWILAPAYDMLPNKHEEYGVDMCLSLCGKLKNHNLGDFEKTGKTVGMSREEIADYMRQSARAVREQVLPGLPDELKPFFEQHLEKREALADGHKTCKGQEPTLRRVLTRNETAADGNPRSSRSEVYKFYITRPGRYGIMGD